MPVQRRQIIGCGLTFGLLGATSAGRAQSPPDASAKRAKILVVFQPDRPMDWFVDALPARFIGLPWQEKSERVSIPGMNFQAIALRAFYTAASKAWPHVEFVALPEFAIEQSAKAGPEFLEATWPRPLQFGDALDALLPAHGADAVITLSAWQGGEDRPRPHGAVGIFCAPLGSSITKNLDEMSYRASLRWFLHVNVTEQAKTGFWGRGGMKSTYMGTVAYSSKGFNTSEPDQWAVEGSRAQITEALSSRSREIVGLVDQSSDQAWETYGIRRARENLSTSKERQPYYYTLPL